MSSPVTFPFSSSLSSELFEERALLLGRLGRHDVALAIYAHVLSDPQMAENYCKRTYDPENEENKDVREPVEGLSEFTVPYFPVIGCISLLSAYRY